MEIKWSVIRPASIHSPKSYNARLDSPCARVVKSAPFGSLVESLKLIGDVDIIADNIIERIASSALKVGIISSVDCLRLMVVNRSSQRIDATVFRVEQHVGVMDVERLDAGSYHENAS